MAKGEGISPKHWLKHDNSPWVIVLAFREIAHLGEGRIGIYSASTRELIMLHPLGGRAIDPSRVVGL